VSFYQFLGGWSITLASKNLQVRPTTDYTAKFKKKCIKRDKFKESSHNKLYRIYVIV